MFCVPLCLLLVFSLCLYVYVLVCKFAIDCLMDGWTGKWLAVRVQFVWIGDTAIGLWGDADGADVPGMGWDGTAGNQVPRYWDVSL